MTFSQVSSLAPGNYYGLNWGGGGNKTRLELNCFLKDFIQSPCVYLADCFANSASIYLRIAMPGMSLRKMEYSLCCCLRLFSACAELF